jgi:hypothetical protein
MASSIEGSKSIVMDGLVLYVDAANPRCYTPSATTLKELTEVNTGNLIAGVGYSSSNLGSWTFDGTDDYIDLGTRLPSLGLTYPMSIDIWFKPTSGLSTSSGIFAGAVNPVNNVYLGFSIILSLPTYVIQAQIGDGAGAGSTNRRTLLTTQSVNAGAWNHVVATASTGPVFEVYINGVLATGATSGTGGPLSWGTNATAQIASYAGFPNELSGSVASAKYYNKKLSASEVLQNYNAGRYRFGL